MDAIHQKEYHVRQLKTRTVTLFPSRAHVVRDLKDVPLKPGTNEVTILGLTPTVDESTIKVEGSGVEGSGAAVITDIATELLPNRDAFDDIYPDSDDETTDEDPDEDMDWVEDDVADSPELEAVRAQLFDLRDEERRAKEIVDSAASRLKILDAYGKSLDRKKSINISESIDAYRSDREKVFQDHMAGIVRGRENAKHLAEALKEESRLVKLKEKEVAKLARERQNAQKEKEKIKQKDARRKAERQKEKDRIRKERERFWPKVCYSVRVTLEAHIFTPMSSRRTSISSETALTSSPTLEADNGASPVCNLSLSYVTSSASWVPSYDLQLSTTGNNAMLCYDAKITNETSETWSNCKVTLSTSQTNFAGLEHMIPTLKPWNIKLASKNSGITENKILNSREERQHRGEWWQLQQSNANDSKPRSVLFGVDRPTPVPPAPFAPHTNAFGQVVPNPNEEARLKAMIQAQQMQQIQMQQRNIQSHVLARPAMAGSLFGGSSGEPAVQQQEETSVSKGATASLFGGPAQATGLPRAMTGGLFGSGGSQPGAASNPFASSSTSLRKGKESSFSTGAAEAKEEEEEAALDFQESTMEETGFTTTYDLPGFKTLPPRPTASKQRVTRLNFSAAHCSHTIVAKYKPVAYLKAKVRNSSKITLLRGETGLTLDGTFMGRTTLPRCSAGDIFSLSLGIDPAIKVNYPKVDVRRATTGFFSKENSSVYTRSITIANSRLAAGKPVSLLVLDQVPVSEDERLKVDILAPRGMALDGSGVPVGKPGRSDKEDTDWGKAVAKLKKSGQVEWEVSLNAGKAVKLALEYVVAMPSGDTAVEC